MNVEVDLDDQFITRLDVRVIKPRHFCNPVDKNGEGISDPTAHLQCYRIKEPRLPSKPNVIVTNQFGTQRLTVSRAKELCVPSEKDMVPSPLNINHFKCYKVKRTKGAPKFEEQLVTLDDQFETGKITRVIKPKLLCTPVDKNGEGIPNPAGHITCFKIKDAPGQPKFSRTDITVTNQFTDDELGAATAGECDAAPLLCVPSTKEITSPSGAFIEMSEALLD